MTESIHVYTSDSSPSELSSEQAPTTESSAVDTIRDQAGTVAQGAADAGQQVAGTAKEQVHNVVAEAGSQAKDLIAQARTEVAGQAGTQQQRLAGGLRSLADELGSMARNSEPSGVATELARQAADHTNTAASWFDSREPGQVLEEIKSFARQKPGTFLAIAAMAGLVAGRVTRGVKDAGGDTNAGADQTGPPSSPTTEPAPMMVAPFASSQEFPAGYPAIGDHR